MVGIIITVEIHQVSTIFNPSPMRKESSLGESMDTKWTWENDIETKCEFMYYSKIAMVTNKLVSTRGIYNFGCETTWHLLKMCKSQGPQFRKIQDCWVIQLQHLKHNRNVLSPPERGRNQILVSQRIDGSNVIAFFYLQEQVVLTRELSCLMVLETILVTGCNDGDILVWDIPSRQIELESVYMMMMMCCPYLS